MPSEGGHTDFAPNSDSEIELLRHLRGSYLHVSYERIVSGPGLHAIYEYLRDTKKNEPTWLSEKIKAGDPARPPAARPTPLSLAGFLHAALAPIVGRHLPRGLPNHGSLIVTDAALTQAGVIRCTTIEEMFNNAIALTYDYAHREELAPLMRDGDVNRMLSIPGSGQDLVAGAAVKIGAVGNRFGGVFRVFEGCVVGG